MFSKLTLVTVCLLSNFVAGVVTPAEIKARQATREGIIRRMQESKVAPRGAKTSPLPGQTCFCPPEDEEGFKNRGTKIEGNKLLCSYPAYKGEDFYDFYCVYNANNGKWKQDHNAGLCPLVAKCNKKRMFELEDREEGVEVDVAAVKAKHRLAAAHGEDLAKRDVEVPAFIDPVTYKHHLAEEFGDEA